MGSKLFLFFCFFRSPTPPSQFKLLTHLHRIYIIIMFCVKYKLLLWGLKFVALQSKSFSSSQDKFSLLYFINFILYTSLKIPIATLFDPHHVRKKQKQIKPHFLASWIISFRASNCATHTPTHTPTHTHNFSVIQTVTLPRLTFNCCEAKNKHDLKLLILLSLFSKWD